MVRQAVEDMTILMPGIGSQGGEIKETVLAGQNKQGLGLIVVVGRSIIYAEDPVAEAKTIVSEINASR